MCDPANAFSSNIRSFSLTRWFRKQNILHDYHQNISEHIRTQQNHPSASWCILHLTSFGQGSDKVKPPLEKSKPKKGVKFWLSENNDKKSYQFMLYHIYNTHIAVFGPWLFWFRWSFLLQWKWLSLNRCTSASPQARDSMIRTIRSNPRCMEHHGTRGSRRDLHLGWKRTAHGTWNNNPFTCVSRNTPWKKTKPLALVLWKPQLFCTGVVWGWRQAAWWHLWNQERNSLGGGEEDWWKLGFYAGVAE